MVRWRRLARQALGSGVTSSATLPGCLATGFFEPVVEHRVGVTSGPLIGKHLVETRVVVVQVEEQFAEVGPRFDPVAFRAGEDREQDGRPRSGLLAAEEQPVLSLMRSFA